MKTGNPNSQKFGASFSVPYAQYLGLDPKKCLNAAITDLGIKRFRMMSYWNRLEPDKGEYDFAELDWQIDMAEQSGADVSLCLGLRQPRWPESHWPDWALNTPGEQWQPALMDFIKAIVERYKDRSCIISYQLENEALNRSFGENGNFDRQRLIREFELVKQLDPSRPVIMSTSNSWGIPFFGPTPDLYGFSIYRYFYQNGSYRHSKLPPLFFRLRAFIIRLVKWRKTYIHEFQTEPWGPKAIPDMSIEEQFESINPDRIKEVIPFAKSTGLLPADLWGLEWWYWLKVKHGNTEIWDYLRSVYRNN